MHVCAHTAHCTMPHAWLMCILPRMCALWKFIFSFFFFTYTHRQQQQHHRKPSQQTQTGDERKKITNMTALVAIFVNVSSLIKCRVCEFAPKTANCNYALQAHTHTNTNISSAVFFTPSQVCSLKNVNRQTTGGKKQQHKELTQYLRRFLCSMNKFNTATKLKSKSNSNFNYKLCMGKNKQKRRREKKSTALKCDFFFFE